MLVYRHGGGGDEENEDEDEEDENNRRLYNRSRFGGNQGTQTKAVEIDDTIQDQSGLKCSKRLFLLQNILLLFEME